MPQINSEQNNSYHISSTWNKDEIDKAKQIINEPSFLFIKIAFLMWLIFFTAAAAFYFLIYPRLYQIHILFANFFLFVIIGVFLIILLDFFLIILSSVFHKNFLFYRKNFENLKISIPIILSLGKLLKIDKDRIASSFIKFNNNLTKIFYKNFDKEKILILLPRCIQDFNCRQNIVEDINNCLECGKCIVKSIKNLINEKKIKAYILTGGSAARKIIIQNKPQLIIAVACERELLSGLVDVKFIPVICLPNIRDEGPCKNTKINIDDLKYLIKELGI